MSYIFVALICLALGGIGGYLVGRKNPDAAGVFLDRKLGK